jgi:hypothetical protein
MGVFATTGNSASRRMLASLRALALFAFANLIWLQPAAARIKFIDTAEQIARADLIVVGRVISVAQGKPARFKLKIERSLLGAAKGTLQLDSGYWQIDWPAKKKCESALTRTAYERSQFGRISVTSGTSNVLICGGRRIFYLTQTPSTKDALEKAVLLSRVGSSTRAEIKRVQAAIRMVPKWRTTASGLAVVLLPTIDAWPASEGLALQFGIRNVSDHAIQLNYGGNTRAQRSFVALDIVDRSGKQVAALPHPQLDAKTMQEFFKLFGASKPILLASGEYFFQRLDRINLDGAGWGYKEALDFQFYPLAPGRYTIVARGLNYLPGVVLSTAALEVDVK